MSRMKSLRCGGIGVCKLTRRLSLRGHGGRGRCRLYGVSSVRRRAFLFLAPVLIALAAVVWIALTTSGPRLVAELPVSDVISGLLAIQVLILVAERLAVGSPDGTFG
jgi:hypothetical protein